MLWIALGLLGLFLALLLLRAFADSTAAQVKTAVIWGGGALGLVLLAVLLISGRGGQAVWAAVLFGPAAVRGWRAWRAARTFARQGAASPNQASDVETAYLAMALDHDSGRMTGRVKQGRFAGQDLAALDLPGLLDLLAEVTAADPDSVPLLEAWLDRALPEWRSHAPEVPRPGDGKMTRAEALAILGLAEGADEAAIQSAYRRLMRTAHPDQGGSDWLAARLNEARDILVPD